jgi:Zn-finger nucleic acid-binding protein
MRCPHCPDATLSMTDRQGIEIDFCPQCRGVWLDRGELDKLIERALFTQAPQRQSQPAGPQHYAPSKYGPPNYTQPHYKHKKSWLSEIFD